MALRNRKEIPAKDLEGVHRETTPSYVKFGNFTHLENWTAAGIGSIKKKRGVELAIGGVPPGGGEAPCPDDPTVTHIDDGFTHITLGQFSLDLTGLVAFYGSNLNSAISRFDLDGLTVTHTTDGNGRLWQFPGYGAADGDLYAQDFTLGGGSQRIVQLNPADLSEIRVSGVIAGMAVGSVSVTATRIYTTFGSAFVNQIYGINKSDLSVAFSMGAIDGRYGGGAVDGDGNLWMHGRTTPSISKITPSGAVTTHSIASAFPAGTALNLSYDSTNNFIIIIGAGVVASWSIASSTLNVAPFNSDGFIFPTPVGGKIWRTGLNLTEFQISDWSTLQTISTLDIVGTVALSWQNAAYLSSVNCIHLAHGQIGGSDGGVDRLCLPCP